MKTAVVRHILKRESRADLFRLYPKSLFLSGLFLLLCAGSSSLYAFLSETTIAYLPSEAGGAVRELCFFGMILLFSPFFGGVLAHFGRLARKNEQKDVEIRAANPVAPMLLSREDKLSVLTEALAKTLGFAPRNIKVTFSKPDKAPERTDLASLL